MKVVIHMESSKAGSKRGWLLALLLLIIIGLAVGLPLTCGSGDESAGPSDGELATRTVVSGKMVSEGGEASEAYPPGFVPCDDFVPGDQVWAYGYGFEYPRSYQIWIQAYTEGELVASGGALDPASCPYGFDPVNDPVAVDTAEDGTFGPTRIWDVPQGQVLAYGYWEIVADRTDEGAANTGFYDPEEDGLDAVTLDKPGIHVLSEALTIVLVSVVLVGLLGYQAVRKRTGMSRLRR